MTQLISFVLPSHLPGMGGWGNGYVAVPKGHPCYELDYDQIHDKFDINVNGGLTYAGWGLRGQPEEVEGMWVVGFDTLHSHDDMTVWPDESSVLREANLLKQQLEAISH